MRRYESVIIVDPDLPEEDRDGLFQKLTDLIAQNSGFLVDIDAWGNRKLAYEIRKKPRGFYARFDFCGTGALVDELERNLRIDDRYLKYMTVLLDREVDLDALKAAKAEAEAEKAAAKEAAAKEAAAKEAAAKEAAAKEAAAAKAAAEAEATPSEATEAAPEDSAPGDSETPEPTDISEEAAPETASPEEAQTDPEEAASAAAEEAVATTEETTEPESKEA